MTKVLYCLSFPSPHTHRAQVKMHLREVAEKTLRVFLPAWTAGSYLIRDYARFIEKIHAYDARGNQLPLVPRDKQTWELENSPSELWIEYTFYAKEFSVRTNFVDIEGASLCAAATFLGVVGQENLKFPQVKIDLPEHWQKISTGLSLKDQTSALYEALDYHHLIDTPLLLGNQDTSGFLFEGKEHHIVMRGRYPQERPYQEDFKKIVKTVCHIAGHIPYESYWFLSDFVPGNYGGLEHYNSTRLIFDSREMNSDSGYYAYLRLVCHEFIHTWNVKQIRPRDIYHYDYTEENYTKMLWLVEGLTSFIDDYFLHLSGVTTRKQLLEEIVKNINRHLKYPGRRFQSLEESSFYTWTKFYKRNENTSNVTISYYLKGALVFMLLHGKLREKGHSIGDLFQRLYHDARQDTYQGHTKEQVLSHIKNLSDEKTKEDFNDLLELTEELDFESFFSRWGMQLEWDNSNKKAYWGCEFLEKEGRVHIKSVILDSPAYRAGLNAEDEIVAIDGHRVYPQELKRWQEWLRPGEEIEVLVARRAELKRLHLHLEKTPPALKTISVLDAAKADQLWHYPLPE